MLIECKSANPSLNKGDSVKLDFRLPNYPMLRSLSFIVLVSFFAACGPKVADLDYAPRSLNFANREWWVKTGPEIQGPGNNFFHYRNAWVDWAGNLHLKVFKRGDFWTCGEVYSKENLGYGRYEITVDGDLGDLDANLVFGFFTWDPSNFEHQANSEIDIEFSRWGYPLAPRVLHYSVHPVSMQKLFLERFQSSNSNPKNWNGRSKHVIEWRDTSVTFYSYKGPEKELKLLEKFHYSIKNPPRRKGQDGVFSEPIRVPKPGPNNQARLNLWIFNDTKSPLNAKSAEVIIRDFQFEAY